MKVLGHYELKDLIKIEEGKSIEILLFHHGDLDGVMPIVISELIQERLNYKVSFHCHLVPVTLDTELPNYTDEMLESYDVVLIVDISLKNKNNIERLQRLYEKGLKIQLLDHHATALGLNEYDWACVLDYAKYPDCENKSATNMYYDYMKDLVSYLPKYVQNLLGILVDLTGEYDTYHFKKTDNKAPYDLNQVFKSCSYTEFIYEMKDNIEHKLCLISKSQYEAINTMRNVVIKAIGNVFYNMNTYVIEGYKIAVAYNTTPYLSEISDEILEANPSIDFICLINPSFQSLRLTTRKDDVDILEMVRVKGGGGHKYACGSPLTNFKLENVFDFKSIAKSIVEQLIVHRKEGINEEWSEVYIDNCDLYESTSEMAVDWLCFSRLGKNARLTVDQVSNILAIEVNANELELLMNKTLQFNNYTGEIRIKQ